MDFLCLCFFIDFISPCSYGCKGFFLPFFRWFASWQRYVGQGSDGYPINRHLSDSQHLDVVPSKTAERPGPIDNSDIVSNGNEWDGNDMEILRTLEEGRDYVLVPQEVWEKLFEW